MFHQLGKEDKLIEYHNIIYQLTGVVIDFINVEGRTMNILPVQHLNAYCACFQNASSSPCQVNTTRYLQSAKALKHELVYKCHAGLTDLILPLFDREDKYIGALTAGQFFIEGEAKLDDAALEELQKREQLPLSAKQLAVLYHASPSLSQGQLQGLLAFLRNIGEIIIEARNKIIFWQRSNAQERIQLIYDYIKRHYMKTLNVELMATRFFMSPNYFCRYFKKNAGVSFLEYLNMYRVKKAEELLLSRQLSVNQISLLCGFGSLSQFYRCFKQIKGQTPSQLRKSLGV